MNSNRIAALLTCHNRKQKTLACLTALFNQELPAEVSLDAYLVDDGSTDGTAEAVRQNYPQVKITYGDGNLFWNRGMRQAFSEALKSDYDFYLWLNDDTIVYPQTVKTLLATYQSLGQPGNERVLVVASTCDPDTQELTYGGVVRSTWWHPFKYRVVEPGTEAKPCDTLYGNCVLIPRVVVQIVGNLDSAFVHSMGDIDYGLRAKRQGCSIWIAPGYLATCKVNPVQGDCWLDPNLTLPERWKKVVGPKGLPLAESKVLAQRHAGLLWPIYWLLPYVRVLSFGLFRKAKERTENC